MYIVLFPTTTAGCFVANGGDVQGQQFAFTTIEKAKKATELFLKTQNMNAAVQSASILLLDLDNLQIVSSIHRLPSVLLWVDRR